MRSRFTAFVKGNLVYIQKTVCGPAKAQFDYKDASSLVQKIQWEKLEVLSSQELGNKGTVEFCATFTIGGETRVMHETSSFKKIKGQWLYFSGDVSFRG